jgi:tRNA threonylcarbamoyladenosine biosynthesis protein TsaB
VRILAIDTALAACSICVMEEGAAAPLMRESLVMERGHAEALVPLLQKTLHALDGGLKSINKIAVCVGPGSFTGLRVGLSAARALGLAAGVPVVGVTSLSAYAAPHIIAGTTLSIATLIDARHGNAYCQCVTGGGRMLIAPARMAVPEIIEILNRSGGVKVVGPGADLLRADLGALGLQIFIEASDPAPDIAWIARLGLAANPETAPPDPLYLRGADATPQGHTRIAHL